MMMRIRLFKSEVPETRQLSDPFSSLYSVEVIEPPYNLEYLQQLPEMSNILQQAIDAYVTNLVGFGWTLVPTDPEIDENPEMEKEYAELEELFKYASPQGDITTILAKVIADRERTGNGYLEVIRGPDGKIVSFAHVPAHTVRITPAQEPQTVKYVIPLPDKEKVFLVRKRFRKYVQIVDGQKVYFKEFGDPRTMDYETGEYKEVPFSKRATEIIHFKIDSPTSVYGVPRYIGNLLAILGSRKAEELNYSYFLSGKHIPMAILVQNGFLTESSVEKLQEYLSSLGGIENAHKFLVLESVSPDDPEGSRQTRIDIKPLVDALQEDALFVNYDAKNREKIRSAFRLPPLFVGETHEYNRATAETSYKVANEQVFRPLQKEIERIINNTIVADLGIRYWRFKLNTPELVDALEQARMIAPFISAGAVSPNLARQILSKLINEEIPEYEGEWAELPLQIVQARMKMGYDIDQPVEKRDPLTKLLEALRELRHHGSEDLFSER